MRIEDSIALVTGANRGLGHALVTELLKAGVKKVYATSRDKSKITSTDARVVPLALDANSPAGLAAAAEQAGDINLLVNNAGVLGSFDVIDTPIEAIEADFRTNTFGTLAVSRAFLPALERANGATILNILSLASLSNIPMLGGYSASKAASYSLTLALRAKLKAKNIAVVAALPGVIDTDMVRAFPVEKTSAEDVAKGILLGLSHGEEEIFPDAMAQQFAPLWKQGTSKALESAFASMGG